MGSLSGYSTIHWASIGGVMGLFWIAASILCLLLYILEECSLRLPQFLKDLLVYGKVQGTERQRTFVQLFEVPKKWFTHFYVVGACVNGCAVCLLVLLYVFKYPLPSFIDIELKYLKSSGRISTDCLSALLLVTLMFVQNCRRLYECLFVSVYSSGTMNIIHYCLGIILYSTFALAVISEAPHTIKQGSQDGPCVKSLLAELSWQHIAGTLLFVWASLQHHIVHRQFAAFICNDKGEVVTVKHFIPYGGWFELVSCPHYFMEILIYLSFALIGGYHHVTLLTIVLFVLTNQIVASVMTHNWYIKKYRGEYPAHRRAFIPYVL